MEISGSLPMLLTNPLSGHEAEYWTTATGFSCIHGGSTQITLTRNTAPGIQGKENITIIRFTPGTPQPSQCLNRLSASPRTISPEAAQHRYPMSPLDRHSDLYTWGMSSPSRWSSSHLHSTPRPEVINGNGFFRPEALRQEFEEVQSNE